MPKFVVSIWEERHYRVDILVDAPTLEDAFDKYEEDYSAGIVLSENLKDTNDMGHLLTLSLDDYFKNKWRIR